MRRIGLILIFLTIISLLPNNGVGAAGTPVISLVINNYLVESDVPPVIVSGRTLVPVRIIMENLGAQVDWSDATQSVTITGAGKVIGLKIGSRAATVNGTGVTLDVPAQIINKRTVVPLRFVSETMGAVVNWDEKTNTVSISTRAPKLVSVEYLSDAGGVRVVLTADGAVDYQTAYLGEQDQVQINLPRSVLDVPVGTTQTDAVGLRQIQIKSAEEERAYPQVVIDLENGQPYLTSLSSDGRTLTIHIPYRITAVELNTLEDVDTLLVNATGPLQYTLTETDNPRRLAIEITGAVLAMPDCEQPINNGYISSLRYAQVAPDRVLITMDLLQPVRHRLVKGDHSLALHFDPLLTELVLTQSGLNGTLLLSSLMPLVYTVEPGDSTNQFFLILPGAVPAAGGSLKITGGAGPDVVIPFSQLTGEGIIHHNWLMSVRMVTDAGDPNQTIIRVEMASGYEYREQSQSDRRSISFELLARPLAGKTVVLDPGHGGTDPGAVGYTGKFERDFNHIIAGMLGPMLEQLGATVMVTNTVDNYMDGYTRAEIANVAGADVYLSIHANAFTSSASNGTEVYYWTTNPASPELAEIIYRYLLPATGLYGRGVKSERFIVIRETTMPSALIEVAFISNPAEEKLLFSPVFQQKVAQALRDGLLEFLMPGWLGQRDTNN